MGGGESGEEGEEGQEYGLPVSSPYKATSCLVRSGVWEEENLARKVEGDWNMVYLCLLFIKQPPAVRGIPPTHLQCEF